MTQFRTDPKTGRMETIKDGPEVVTQVDVDRTRRELKDMLAGNTKFHEEKKDEPPVAYVVGVHHWSDFQIRFGAEYLERIRRELLLALDTQARVWNAHDEDYGVNRDA